MIEHSETNHTERQPNLLILVCVFIFLLTAALALAPSTRTHQPDLIFDFRFAIPFSGWLAGTLLLNWAVVSQLPRWNTLVLPLGTLMSGWGLLTIWRLSPSLGIKQLIWFLLGSVLFAIVVRIENLITLLKKFKYVWLMLGLALVILTFFVGVNPSGSGPRLWLNLFGLYFQPSEPLKLLLIVYLAAFFSDQIRPNVSLGASILPTLIILAVVGVLLVGQRDLGTAGIFLSVYVFMLVATTHRRRFLWIFPLVLLIVGVTGYYTFEVVKARVDIWLNPWLKTSGASYQLVQAQIATAVGSLFGTGPGLGSPQFIPVAVSDFIFSAISEETGLLGSSALLIFILILTSQGIAIALKTKTAFGRYLAFGISVYFGLQSFFIIGGNLGLIPLTGVTLPFFSYGGSSLLTNMICLLILIRLSAETNKFPLAEKTLRPYQFSAAVLLVLFFFLIIKNGFIAIINRSDIISRPENSRWIVYDLYSPRGNIETQAGEQLAVTTGSSGNFEREVAYPPISPVIGYTQGLYGQSGLEKSIYPFLRGYGKSYEIYRWHEILYNQPPVGSDVKINLDLSVQKSTDQLLGNRKGAVVLLNARTGEIYVMASHPNFDANTLAENWAMLMESKDAPLLNRCTQAAYPIGTLASLFALNISPLQPNLVSQLSITSGEMDLQCRRAMRADNGELNGLKYGCEKTSTDLLKTFAAPLLAESARALGMFNEPTIALEVAPAAPDPNLTGNYSSWLTSIQKIPVSPLQMVLISATITNHGIQPAPKLVNSYQDENGEWIAFPDQGDQTQTIDQAVAERLMSVLRSETQSIWSMNGHALIADDTILTWYIGGTTPDWTGSPLAIAVAIEGNNPTLAQTIGRQLLNLGIAD